MDLLTKYGARQTVRGGEDMAFLEAYGDVAVTLKWIMDPFGSDTLTYAQIAQALAYALEVIDGDIYTPEAVNHELVLSVSVGQDKKFLLTITQEDGDQFHAQTGRVLEVNCQTYVSRPISRIDTAASLSAAEAEFNRHPDDAVPTNFALTVIRGRVQFKMLLGLAEQGSDWPHFTFADLLDATGAAQSVLQRAEAPSADSWGALFASIETQSDGYTVGFVYFEAVTPGVHMLNSENSTLPSIAPPGNSSAVANVDVT